jgi:signal transduction histidine kinase
VGGFGLERGVTPPQGRRDGGGPAGQVRPAFAAAALLVMNTAVRAPFTSRSRRELLFCVVGIPFCVPVPLVAFFAAIWLAIQANRRPWTVAGNPSWLAVAIAAAAAATALMLLGATPAARWIGAKQRRLAALLLGERVPPPPPVRMGGDRASLGVAGRLGAGLRDAPGWRAVAYLMLKWPVALLGLYAIFFWVDGLINMSYPFWWLSFRNHPPGVRLNPVPVFTPFGWFGQGSFQIATYPGTFAALAAGAGMLLAAPWVTRAVVSADRWLIHGLLGPSTLRERLANLEQTRALAVDDSAALLRQLERNLHDGAQIRLATLAMNLGMAREKLGEDGDPRDLAAARELLDAAHRGAKDALSELRELVKGIHPPVLDNGLAEALATMAAGSPIPVKLTTRILQRPTPAIETIAYFCAAELLANAVKHSSASSVEISATQRAGALTLTVTDDGAGGAAPARGSGLAGLAQRVSTVDGRLEVASPPGGPTRISIELPLHA